MQIGSAMTIHKDSLTALQNQAIYQTLNPIGEYWYASQ